MTTSSSELKRSLSMSQLIFMGLVFIGPLAPIGIFGTLDAKSNGAVATVYLVATFALALTGSSYMRMSREVPRAGSVFAYANAGIGPRTGYIAGWMILLDYVLVPSIAFMIAGIAINSLFPAIPLWLIVTVAIVIGTGLNLAGISIASRVITFVVILEIIALAIYLVAGIYVLITVGPNRDWLSPFTGVNGTTIGAVLAAVSVAVLSFIGFDSLATFSEETKGGHHVVGRATLICLVIAGILFVSQTYVASLLSNLSPDQIRADPSLEGLAFYKAIDVSIGAWAHWMMALIKGIGMAFCAMVGQAAGARIILDMSRSGQLPTALSKVSSKRQVPSLAIIVVAICSIGVSLWTSTRADGLDLLSSLVNMGALVAFVLLHASVIGYYLVRQKASVRGHWFSHGVIPAVGALMFVFVIIAANPLAQIVAVIWLAVGLIYAIATRQFGKAEQNVPDLEEEPLIMQ